MIFRIRFWTNGQRSIANWGLRFRGLGRAAFPRKKYCLLSLHAIRIVTITSEMTEIRLYLANVIPPMTPLQKAAFELRLDDLKQLATKDADLRGALLSACSAHDPDAKVQVRVIRFLMKRGVSVDETDKNGVTPLHRAVRFRSVAAAKELLAQGADVKAIDRKSKSTPLHRAVTSTGAPSTAGKQAEALSLVRLLLENGADMDSQNKSGKRPIDYAQNQEIKAALTGVSP